MVHKAVVFFSHSSDDNPRATDLVQAIEGAGDIKTTFDLRDLRDGQDWKRQLYRWVARCDAGFLFLTEAVMKRPGWVLQEATLLRARQIYAGESFPLFVMVDKAAREHENWKTLFAPLALTELERTDTAMTPQQVGAAVLQACKDAHALAATDYFSSLRDHVFTALEPFANNPVVAKALHAQLDMADEYWAAIVGGDDVLADTLAKRLCEAQDSAAIGRFAGLDAFFQTLYLKGRAEDRDNLLHAMRPYWVDLGAAIRLAAATRAPAGQRLCVLATAYADTTPDLHIDRFFAPLTTMPIVLHITGGNESMADLSVQIVLAWNQRFQRAQVATPQQVNERLDALTVGVVVILPPLRAATLAREAAQAFPRATFVVPVPHGLDLRNGDWQGFQLLEPARSAEQEKTFVAQYDGATAYL